MTEPKRKPNATITCLQCGARRAMYVRRSNPQRFCSRPCALAWTVVNRKSGARFGADHHAWKGDQATARTGRTRALRAFPDAEPCVDCGITKGERHHRDENTLNNARENIEFVCHKCHCQRHLVGLQERAKAQQPLAVAARWRGHEPRDRGGVGGK